MEDTHALWHAKEAAEIMEVLDTTPQGLSLKQVSERSQKYGRNALEQSKGRSLISIFLSQFTDLMIWILMAAAVISAFSGEWVDCAIILFVVVLNAVLGTIQESRAEAALEALKNMMTPMARVMRDGSIREIPAGELVPGDIALLEAGDSVPADLRLISSSSLKAEESALTGESLPVEKDASRLAAPDAALGDRVNMAYMGTSVTYGRGVGVVAETGMNTQMGKIAGQLLQAEKETTPLSQAINRTSNTLSIGVIIIAVIIFAIGLMEGGQPLDMFLTAVSLAVAAIPEGLVAVITIVLALGMSRMAQRGAIIRRLPAVETLGSTQVICSDKTGTLTQNRMTVEKTFTEDEGLLWQAMGHCNDASLSAEGKAVGDPTETALIDYILQKGYWTAGEIHARSRVGEIPFDSQRKRSTVAVSLPGGGVRIFVKGAPDVLIERCVMDAPRHAEAVDKNDEMASQALRVMAFAYKDAARMDESDVEGTESGLTFLGLAGMIDPPRPEVRDAIGVCRRAGILPVMITGDHKATAMAIAEQLDMLSDGREAVSGAELEQMDDGELERRVQNIGVYARVAPEHKSRIVRMWQKLGRVVAMTGDGVNDAPALKVADIGVGMGITGTDVSKGASDMVLTDDNFATIVTAVGEGRRIYDNIHKTTRFLLSSNMGEVLSILVATILGWRLLTPVHILWINLVTDTFPALALGVEPEENDIMTRPPRDRKRPLLSGVDWFRIVLVGMVEAALTFSAYLLGSQVSHQTGMTMAFLTLSLSQLFAAFGFQSERHSIFSMKPGRHKALWFAILGSTVLQLAVVAVPWLRSLFDLTALSFGQCTEVFLLCLAMLLFVELQKLITRIRERRNH